MPGSNPFSVLMKLDDESIGRNTTAIEKQLPKPSPIYIEAQIIEPLTELMEKIANDDCTLKQLKDNQVKVQVNTPETYRELILVLKDRMQTSTPIN